MKIHKKIWLGLFLPIALLGISFFLTPKASAATQDDIYSCVNSLIFVSHAEIDCTFTPQAQTTPSTIKFIDATPDEAECFSVTNGCPHSMNFQESGSAFFCDGVPSDHNILNNDIYYDTGITVQPNKGDIVSGPLTQKDAGKKVKLVINVRYQTSATDCVYPNGKDHENLPNIIKSDYETQGIANLLQFTPDGIDKLNEVTKSDVGLTNSWTLTSYSGIGNTLAFVVDGYKPGSCSGDIIFITEGSNVATRYTLNSGNNLEPNKGYDELINFLKDPIWRSDGCGIEKNTRNFFSNDTSTAAAFHVFGTPPSKPSSNGPGDGGGGGSTAKSCESNSTLGLEWIICPVLRGIDGMVNTLYGLVESQLCFPAGKSSTGTSVNCGQSYLTDQVKATWSLMKNLVSGLIVIIMLVMIISQAIGSGLFDAYTIRKVLPKLVMAVILIQISWVLAKWLIDVSNDAGRGIGDLMLAPFPDGTNSIDIALANIGSTGVLTGAAIFGGAAALVAFSGLTIFGILIMAISGLAALFIGFLVLFFRQILIVLSVIFIPLALVAWILPGTEKLWKLWKDNFTKLLLMFPMIVAMIAGGRIFGYVAGHASGNDHEILNFFAVLIGFFGPLFILPKTFKWGGTALSSLGGAIVNSTKGVRKMPREFAMNSAKINREQRSQDRLARLAEGRSAHRRWDEFLAGRNNVALSRGTRLRRFEQNRAKGREEAEKAHAAGVIGSVYENLDHEQKIDDLTDRAQGGVGRHSGIQGGDPADQRYVLDELAKYGDWDRISNLRDGHHIDERTWQAWLAKNISGVHQNIPHLSPQRTDLGELGYEERAGYKDFEHAELREQAENYQVRDPATGDRVTLTDPAERLAHRIRHVSKAREALDDPQVRRRMTEEGIRENEAIAALSVETPTVQVVTSGNRRARVFLPTDLSTAPARESITQALITTGAGGDTVRQTLAHRIIEADHATPAGSTDEANFAGYMAELESQAATSSVAKQAHNEMVDQIWNSLNANIAETERSAVEAGHSANDIATAVADATRHRDEKAANLRLRHLL